MILRNSWKRYYSFNCVPKHAAVNKNEVQILENLIRDSGNIVVLTGAGISTESGIPDYRSAEVGLYARSNHKPIQYMEFLRSAKARQRYWARNYVGWDRFSKCEPNVTHYSIRNLEILHKKVSAVITQNVDNLHFKAGSQSVIELHGSAFRVKCLSCLKMYDRFNIQEQITELNPHMQETSTMIRPDGDVELLQENVDHFKLPFCTSCGGTLKPDIVFFGDNVPRDRVAAIKGLVSACDALLVLGSSLSVYSGYRYILQAVEEMKSVAIVNIGPTRADNLANIKISAKCSDVLTQIC